MKLLIQMGKWMFFDSVRKDEFYMADWLMEGEGKDMGLAWCES